VCFLTKLEDVLDLGLAAILPVYDGGNVTKLITSSGEQIIDPRTPKTVMKNLARIFGVDLAAVREQYGESLNKRHIIPLPFAANFVLIPVKVREHPLGQNDGTLGYVSFREIVRVEKADNKTSSIILKSGVSIPTVVSEATVKEYIKNARLVESLYMAKHFPKAKAAAASNGFSSHEKEGTYGEEMGLGGLREHLIRLLIKVLELQ